MNHPSPSRFLSQVTGAGWTSWTLLESGRCSTREAHLLVEVPWRGAATLGRQPKRGDVGDPLVKVVKFMLNQQFSLTNWEIWTNKQETSADLFWLCICQQVSHSKRGKANPPPMIGDGVLRMPSDANWSLKMDHIPSMGYPRIIILFVNGIFHEINHP